jgi:hypothetical protein
MDNIVPKGIKINHFNIKVSLVLIYDTFAFSHNSTKVLNLFGIKISFVHILKGYIDSMYQSEYLY